MRNKKISKKTITGLKQIPGIGEKMEQRLIKLGYTTIESLKGQNPEEMYRKDCLLNIDNADRCILYVYRLAVYYAENEQHEPERLKWWNWKD